MEAKEIDYIVLARKYRPKTFDDVVGQEHITTTLKNAIRSQHLAHAYLFCGPRGVGKTTCARILAKTINCEHPSENMEACGVCDTCKAFQNNNALNIFELDAASNNSVEDIRRLTEEVRYAPQQGKYKIYIIDEVHMLSSSAFNAFLKTLEEPPAYAIFILATTEKHKILPTILSRCQIFDFKRIQAKAIVHHLEEVAQKEQIETDKEALHVIAQQSEGCMRDALSMMDRLSGFSDGKINYDSVIEHLNILDANSYFRLSEMLLAKEVPEILLFLDELFQKGFEGDLILSGFAEHLRNLLLCRDKKMAKLLDISEVHRKHFFEHAKLIPEAYIISALNILNQTLIHYKTTLNKRLHVELCLIKLTYLNDLVRPGALFQNQSSASPTPTQQVEKKNKPNKAAAPKMKAIPPEVSLAPSPSIKEPNPANLTSKEETDLATSGSFKGSKVLKNESQVIDELKAYKEKPLEQPESQMAREEPLPPIQEKEAKPKVKLKESQSSSVSWTPPAPQAGNSDPSLILKKDFLKEIQKQLTQVNKKVRVKLTQEKVEELFQLHKESLKENNLIQYEQMALMKPLLLTEEEIKILCPTKMTLSYGKTLSKDFRLFVMNRTAQHSLRVKVELDKEADNQAPPPTIKTKKEILEEFLLKNPLLKDVMERLQLSIEY